MPNVYALRGMIPVVDPNAFVHPTATLIGDVIIGAGVYVGPGASLRGDFGRLILEPGSNFQDNCIMHGFPDVDTVVEENGHIGHGAIIHGARIGRNVLVGMNAVVMDYAVVGADSIVAAMSFVKGRDIIPPGTLVAGIPAKVLRAVSVKEREWKVMGTAEYQKLAQVCRTDFKQAEPLDAIDANRPRDYVLSIKPLSGHE